MSHQAHVDRVWEVIEKAGICRSYPLGAQKAETFNGGAAKEANVTGFPKKEVYIATGPVPPALPQDPRQAR
jgi:hypothetical protein